uniref:Uncharacterized protein n=1 Tax=Anopheles culicifacies TaxID=139723 RepID=A0A182MVH0_9DIPT
MGNVVIESDSRDKIVRPPVERLQLNADYDTPPEPNYAAPKPPARKGVSKAKSMANLTNGNDAMLGNANSSKHFGEEIYELRSPQSVEVLSDPYERAAAPSPPPSPIHVVPITPIPRSTSSNSLPIRETAPDPVKQEVSVEPDYMVPLASKEPITPIPRTTSSNSLPIRDTAPVPVKREVSTEPDYIVPLASEESFDEPIYDSFNAIFERVKIRKPVSPGSERSNVTPRPETSSPVPQRLAIKTPEDAAIFERVKIPNSPTRDSYQSTSSRTPTSSSSPSLSPSPAPSPLPQQKPILKVTSVPAPTTSPPQPKSILKKRAPPPPQSPVEATSSMVEFTNETVPSIPTPPPRMIRVVASNEAPITPSPIVPTDEKKMELPTKDHQNPVAISNGKDPNSDSDDDFNWDFVQKHRSSINQTVAAQTQIDPDVLRNAPASLRTGTPQAVASPRNLPEPIAQPRTLRGMRNQRVHGQLDNFNANTPAVQVPPPRARASDSNTSETSA